MLYPELVDPAGDDVRPWEPDSEGELVLTHLARQCQPLVRFRCGDIVRLSALEGCACGRTVPRFRVIVCSGDMVTVRGINVFPVSVAALVNGFAEMSGEYRILLAGPGPYDRLPLEVELAPGAEAAPALAEALARSIKPHLGVGAEVSLVAPLGLPRTAGKTRRVIRKGGPT